MLDVLRRLNLSYTRSTYTLAKADPQKQEEFKQDCGGGLRMEVICNMFFPVAEAIRGAVQGSWDYYQ